MSESFDKQPARNLRVTYIFGNLPTQPKKKYFIKNIYKVITLLPYYLII